MVSWGIGMGELRVGEVTNPLSGEREADMQTGRERERETRERHSARGCESERQTNDQRFFKASASNAQGVG